MGMVSDILNALATEVQAKSSERNVPREPARSPGGQIVPYDERPLWIRRRWRRVGNEYKGYYRTKYGSFRGKVVQRYSGHFQFFIVNPPACLWDHSHKDCFIPQGGGKYEIHFNERRHSLNEGIWAVERILIEAFENE